MFYGQRHYLCDGNRCTWFGEDWRVMNKRSVSTMVLVCLTCLLSFVPARIVFAEEQTAHVEGKVTFNDDNDTRSERPSSLTVLVGTGRKSDGVLSTDDFEPGTCEAIKLCTLNDSNGWTYSAEVPQRDESGEDLVPVVSLVFPADSSELPPYIATKSGFDFSLSYHPLKFDIPFTIQWNDDNNADGIRPKSASFGVDYSGYGARTVWVAKEDNREPVTDLTLTDMPLYTISTVWNVGGGKSLAIHKTIGSLAISAQIAGTNIKVGSTVESGGYSFTLSETSDEYGIPSYKVVAVHQSKTGATEGPENNVNAGSDSLTDMKTDDSANNDQKNNSVVNDHFGKTDVKTTSKSADSQSGLPKTGDASIFVFVSVLMVGAAFALIGVRLFGLC